jgi:DNA-binding NarL/FixJ family response regulator
MVLKHRILIAEDHTILRDGLRSLLAREPDLEIVGEADNGLDAIAAALRLRPDLVLMDLSMPKLGGLEAMRELAMRCRGTRVLALTVHKTEEYVRAAFDAGAVAYVLKDDSSAELRRAIRSAVAGVPYLSAGIRRATGAAAPQPGGRGGRSAWEGVTPRERQVLKLIAEGHTSRRIAERLGISAKTAEKHRSNLMTKLDLHSVSAVTAFAAKKGLIS